MAKATGCTWMVRRRWFLPPSLVFMSSYSETRFRSNRSSIGRARISSEISVGVCPYRKLGQNEQSRFQFFLGAICQEKLSTEIRYKRSIARVSYTSKPSLPSSSDGSACHSELRSLHLYPPPRTITFLSQLFRSMVWHTLWSERC